MTLQRSISTGHLGPAPSVCRVSRTPRRRSVHDPPEKSQTVCKPGSVLRFLQEGQSFIWDGCCQPPRATHPGREPKTAHARPLFGLAPGGVYLASDVATAAVRSYRTLSPLPPGRRRFAFCGTFPRLAPGGHYPPPRLHGARTFLRERVTPQTATARPSDPADIRANGGGRESHLAGRRI